MNKQMRIKWINQEYEKVVEKNRGVPPDRNIDLLLRLKMSQLVNGAFTDDNRRQIDP